MTGIHFMLFLFENWKLLTVSDLNDTVVNNLSMLEVSDLSLSEATEEVQVELADNNNKKRAYPWKDDQIFTLNRF